MTDENTQDYVLQCKLWSGNSAIQRDICFYDSKLTPQEAIIMWENLIKRKVNIDEKMIAFPVNRKYHPDWFADWFGLHNVMWDYFSLNDKGEKNVFINFKALIFADVVLFEKKEFLEKK
jgi:hypothetical protein